MATSSSEPAGRWPSQWDHSHGDERASRRRRGSPLESLRWLSAGVVDRLSRDSRGWERSSIGRRRVNCTTANYPQKMEEVISAWLDCKKIEICNSSVTVIADVTAATVASPVQIWVFVAVAMCSCIDRSPSKVIPDWRQLDFQIVQSGCGFAQLGQRSYAFLHRLSFDKVLYFLRAPFSGWGRAFIWGECPGEAPSKAWPHRRACSPH